MRNLTLCGMLLALAMPALAQSHTAKPAAPVAASISADDPSAEFVALRDKLADQNKQITAELAAQRSLVKHNQELLKEAEKLDAANKKMEAEKQRLAAQNADLQKQRDALRAAATAAPGTETASLHLGGK